MAQGTAPNPQSLAQLKYKILSPSLTSTFLVEITPPDNDVITKRMQELGVDLSARVVSDYISIPCTEASLPGSSIMTNEIIDDHTGVSEFHGYRRMFDSNSDFTFYVDYEKYYVIKFFESWIGSIVNDNSAKYYDRFYSHRAKFPVSYYSKAFSIQKFERNFGSESGESYRPIQYDFIQAFPTNIASMPVSYESSEILKCNVTFSYSRYILKGGTFVSNNTAKVTPSNAPAIPELGKLGSSKASDPANYLRDTTDSILRDDQNKYRFEFNSTPTRTTTDAGNLV